MTAFKAIPWTEVIAAAPTVVNGARKLFDRVRRREPLSATPPETDPTASPGERIDGLEREVGALQRRLIELEEQQLASTSLVQSLAEQNEKLLSIVNVLRLRTRILLGVSVVLGAGVLFLFFRV